MLFTFSNDDDAKVIPSKNFKKLDQNITVDIQCTGDEASVLDCTIDLDPYSYPYARTDKDKAGSHSLPAYKVSSIDELWLSCEDRGRHSIDLFISLHNTLASKRTLSSTG